MGIGIILEFKNKWILIEKGKKRKPPTFSVFMYFGVLDRLRNPLLKHVSQFLGGRTAHGYCRASFSRLLYQTIFHSTCRWPPSSFKEFRSASVLWNNPWPHNQMDTIPYLTQLTKFVCWQLTEVARSQKHTATVRDTRYPPHGRQKWLLKQSRTGVTEE